jgi:hypothetical protein
MEDRRGPLSSFFHNIWYRRPLATLNMMVQEASFIRISVDGSHGTHEEL